MSPAANEARTVPILLYHSVSSDNEGVMARYTMHPSLFEAHMRWLADHGFTTLTVSQYVGMLRDETPLAERTVLITFDDGYADFADNVVPVLEQFAFTATLYVTTAPVGTTRRGTMAGRPMLTWAELRRITENNVEVGGHSHDHIQLDVAPRREARRQVVTSKQLLEDHLDRAVTSFAYPHGYNAASTRRLVASAGYTSACAVKNARSHVGDDRWALARIMFEGDDGVERLAAACVGSVYPPARSWESGSTKAWRTVRRLRSLRAGASPGVPVVPGA